jgi:hypothetical protein
MRPELLTVVTAVFNPRRFASRIRLYNDFARYVRKAGCRLVTVEVAFGERPFEIAADPDTGDVIHLRTNSELWHKERALNIGIQHALDTPDTKYIAWIDADVTFLDPDWASETVHALQHYDVVQMFGQAAFCDPDDEILWTCPSAFKVFEQKGYHQQPPIATEYIARGHPGLAWACRANTWRNLEGLLDTCVSGSGDTLMAWALRGRWDGCLPPDPLSPGYIAAIKRWARRCDLHVRQNVGYVPGTCLHRWHGKSEHRGYDKRWQIISFHQFDPEQDLVVDGNGLYAWRTGHKPHLEHDLRLSSSSRNEDSL